MTARQQWEEWKIPAKIAKAVLKLRLWEARAIDEEIIKFAEAFHASQSAGDSIRKALRDALKGLMEAITPELTGSPKNVPKSQWAEKWDEAEAALKLERGEQ